MKRLETIGAIYIVRFNGINLCKHRKEGKAMYFRRI